MTEPLPGALPASTGALALDTYQLTKRFGAFTALDSVSLTPLPQTIALARSNVRACRGRYSGNNCRPARTCPGDGVLSGPRRGVCESLTGTNAVTDFRASATEAAMGLSLVVLAQGRDGYQPTVPH